MLCVPCSMENFYNNLFGFDLTGMAIALVAGIDDIFMSSGFLRAFSTAKFIIAIFSIILFIIIVNTLIKLQKMNSPVLPKKPEILKIKKKELTDQWGEIMKKSQSSNKSDWKFAVIDADKLLDYCLRLMGHKGNAMGDRLKKVGRLQFPNLNDIWEAHKLRNRIVHNSQYEISKKELDFALKTYERVFRDLNVL